MGSISLKSHIVVHSAALSFFLEQPLLGIGQKNFGQALARSPYLASPGLLLFIADPTQYPPHSVWLGILAETGILGFLSFLWIK